MVVGWCDSGQVDGRFAADMMTLAARRSLGLLIRCEGSGLLSRQRNEVVHRFLTESTDPWLLLVDTDQGLTVEQFDRLCAAADEVERPVVSGLVFGAWPGDVWPTPIPLIYGRMRDGLLAPIFEYPQDQVVEVDSVGTGCLLVHRSVLTTIRRHYQEQTGPEWAWFADGPVNGVWMSEDLVFCNRVREADYPIHADTGVVLPHRKQVWLDDRHFNWTVSQLDLEGGTE